MTTRRSFIRQTAAWLGGMALHQHWAQAYPAFPQKIDASPDDPQFWRQVRALFSASPGILNLNNAGINPSPRAAQEALDHYNRMCNEVPSYFMWRILDQHREPLRENLAAIAGTSPEEIAINRNATEAINTVIFGLDLKRGDEVVLSKYDYPNMLHAWRQRERRDGIRLVFADFDMPSDDENYLTEAFSSKFSSRTRVVHITHLINWTGQILPVRKIADRARQLSNAYILVDGAQTFAHLDFKIPDLNCDFFGTSLHKWLAAPFGNGMLWVKKEKIGEVHPLLGADAAQKDNIRKFENLGTRSFPIEMATGYAIDLHQLIGAQRKQNRLHSLKNYWMHHIRQLPNIRLWTSAHPDWACGIGNFAIEGIKPEHLAGKLFNDYKIHVVPIEWEKVAGVRVSVNVYTLEEDLDKLVRAIKNYIKP